MRLLLPMAASVILLLSAHRGTRGADPLRVTLESGRTFRAVIDPRTDDTTLWLRFGSHGFSLLRPVLWDRVQAGEVAGRMFTRQELRAAALQLAAPIEKPPAADNANEREAAEYTAVADWQKRDKPAAVGWVEFDARLANWDSDAQADGLWLELYPINPSGQVVPVEGFLEVYLYARRRTAFNSVPHGRGWVPTELAHWSVQATASQIARPRSGIRLPFHPIDLERDTTWDSQGLVTIRYTVPGQGVFEAEQDAVRIRAFAPTRDWNEMDWGRRVW